MAARLGQGLGSQSNVNSSYHLFPQSSLPLCLQPPIPHPSPITIFYPTPCPYPYSHFPLLTPIHSHPSTIPVYSKTKSTLSPLCTPPTLTMPIQTFTFPIHPTTSTNILPQLYIPPTQPIPSYHLSLPLPSTHNPTLPQTYLLPLLKEAQENIIIQ